MTISINWENPNTDFDEVQVFRSDTKPALNEIPTNKILTITDKTVTTFRDTEAHLNAEHWYWIAVKRRQEITYGYPIHGINMPYTGPGPQEILRGDWERGYFGILTTDQMPALQDIFNMITPATGSIYVSSSEWAKFVLHGKILFFPMRMVATNLSWKELYNSGLVYGVGGPGPGVVPNLDPVDQYKTITKGDDQYIVRLPRCSENNDYVTGMGNSREVEWIKTISALFNDYSTNYAMTNSALESFNSNSYFNSSYLTFMAEVDIGGKVFAQRWSTPYSLGAAIDTIDLKSSTNAWRPVLELVL